MPVIRAEATARTGWRGAVHLTLLLSAMTSASCDPSDGSCPGELPTEWTCAEPVEIGSQIETCELPLPGFGVVFESPGGPVRFDGIVFRPNQELCGFQQMDSGAAQVLFQPCDMHPTAPEKGACSYALEVALGELNSETLETFRRFDFADSADPEVEPLGTVAVP